MSPMDKPTINLKTDNNKGAAVALIELKRIGEMTFNRSSDTFIIIDHTEVDPAYKGQNIGRLLLESVVSYARNNTLKIIPLCPFAKRMFERDSSLRDVLM